MHQAPEGSSSSLTCRPPIRRLPARYTALPGPSRSALAEVSVRITREERRLLTEFRRQGYDAVARDRQDGRLVPAYCHETILDVIDELDRAINTDPKNSRG